MTSIASLCSGYGGLELATCGEPIWHAEIEPAMVTVLEKRFEGVPNYGDMRAIDWARVPRPDVVTAGFPCQPISAAGRQRHREDSRYLWPAVARAVAELGPRAVFLENVRNITSIDGGSVLAEVLGDLRAMGYAARWTVLGACAVGLAHHRHRWFCWAEWHGDDAPTAVRVPAKCGAPPRRSRLMPTPRANERGSRASSLATIERTQARGFRLRLDEAVRLLPTPRGRDHKTGGYPDTLSTVAQLLPTPRASDGKNGGPNQRGSKGDLALPSAVLSERWAEYAPAIARHVATTGIEPPEPTEPNRNDEARLAPRFAEWLMDLPAGWVTDVAERVPALKGIGNGVVPRQARAAWLMLQGA